MNIELARGEQALVRLRRIEHPTSNIEWKNMKKQNLKPELIDDILQETEELIKIFVTSIKAAEKKPHPGVVECSVLDVCFSFDVGRSMFDVRRSSVKTIPYGINATCEHLQNNLALMASPPSLTTLIE